MDLERLLGMPGLAGVDEVGRGPLAGPVVAAAVILDPQAPIDGLRDSKKLKASRREFLADIIRGRAVAWAIGVCSPGEIDRLNILQASLLAMRRAIEALTVSPELALVDGNRCPELSIPSRPVVRGDSLVPAISAASIIAKVYRDALMQDLDVRHPGYGFADHKGYPTPVHLEALERLGPSACHRTSFAPVRRALEARQGCFDLAGS